MSINFANEFIEEHFDGYISYQDIDERMTQKTGKVETLWQK